MACIDTPRYDRSRASVPRPKNEKLGHVYFLEYEAPLGDGAYETVGRGSAQLITYTIA